jgi:hypothetical protein
MSYHPRSVLTRSSFTPLTDVLAGLIKTQGFQSRMVEYSLQQQWSEIVGQHIGGHTYPETIRHHKLFLLAENSVWVQQLLFLKSELLSKIAGAIGEDVLNDIVLRVGACPPAFSAPSDADQPAREDAALPLDRVTSDAIEESLRDIPHETLWEPLRALFAKSATAQNFTSGRGRSEKVF